MSRKPMIALAVMTALGALTISSDASTGGAAFAKSQLKPKPTATHSSRGAAGGIVSEGQGYGVFMSAPRRGSIRVR